jgi:lipoate-protein ligase A
MGIDDFRAALMAGLSRIFGEISQYRVTADEWESVDLLAKTKYKSWDWTFGRSPEFTVHHQIRLDSGIVAAHFIVKNGVIRDIELADKSADSSSARQAIKIFVGERYNVNVLQKYWSNSDTV